MHKLQVLWENYRHFGLMVIGLPCADFSAGESFDISEIEQACRDDFGVGFPLTTPQCLSGRGIAPLFAEMRETYGREIMPRQDFCKFLFDQQGGLAERWSHRTEPDDIVVTRQIERNLSNWII